MNTRLPVATYNDIASMAETILAKIGTVTTLHVKEALRASGYWATQSDVSELTELWALQTGRVWNDSVAEKQDGVVLHRVYRDHDVPGQPPVSIHPQRPVPAVTGAFYAQQKNAVGPISTVLIELNDDDMDIDDVEAFLAIALGDAFGDFDILPVDPEDDITNIEFG